VRRCDWEVIGPGDRVRYRGVKDVKRPLFTRGQTEFYDVPDDGIGLGWTTSLSPGQQSKSELVCDSRNMLVTGASLKRLGLEPPLTPTVLGHGKVLLHPLPMDYSQASGHATFARHPRNAAPLGEIGVQDYDDPSGRNFIVSPTEGGTSGYVSNPDGSPAARWNDYLEKSADGIQTPCTRSVWYGEKGKSMFVQTAAWSREGEVETATDLGTF
jgi:hypothetical protein